MNKSDIVYLLSNRFGYRRYLELRTPYTGPDCAIDEQRFVQTTRVLYQTPLSPAYAARADCLKQIQAHSFGIALVDPWHSYAQSYQDIEEIFALLAPGGAMVIHDCWSREGITGAEGWQMMPQGGEWCGDTYAAYIDFVAGRTDLMYLTVDCDYGCGIIFKSAAPAHSPVDLALVSEWRKQHSHQWLQAEGHALLHLMSSEQFAMQYVSGAAVVNPNPVSVNSTPGIANKEQSPTAANTRALVILCVNPATPVCVEPDTQADFRFGFFDFTGSSYVPALYRTTDMRFSHKTAGKGEVMAYLAAQDLGDFDYIAVIDHDVQLSVSAINRLLAIARQHKLDLFQPSLSPDSFISHPHVVQRVGSFMRDTSFVEIMATFFSAPAFNFVKETFIESLSGWGLDLIWSSRIRQNHGKLAIVDDVVAKHLKPLSSHTWRFANGETSQNELMRIMQRHHLMRYRIF